MNPEQQKKNQRETYLQASSLGQSWQTGSETKGRQEAALVPKQKQVTRKN